MARRWLADRVADPDGAQAADRGHLTGRQDVATRRTRGREDADRGRLGLLATADPHTLARLERASEQADERHPLPGGGPLDLEDPAGRFRVRVSGCPGEELVDAGQQPIDADASHCCAEVHGVDHAGPGLGAEFLAQSLVGERSRVADVRLQDRVVVLREGLGQRRAMDVIDHVERHECRGGTACVANGAHGQDARCQPARHRR